MKKATTTTTVDSGNSQLFAAARIRIAPKKPTVEWMVPTDDDPLRQCDVLLRHGSRTEKLSDLYLILTADCDFAHKKHFGQVLCLPIVTISEYVNTFRFPKVVQKLLDQSLLRLLDSCMSVIELTGMSYDRERLIDWLESDGIDAFESVIKSNLTSEESLRNAETVLGEIRKRWELSLLNEAGLDLRQSLDVMQTIKVLDKSDTKEDWAWLQWQNEVKNLVGGGNVPKDVSLLAEISPHHVGGFVVLHRFPEVISDREIAMSSSLPASYTRLSRVVEPYSRAIVNQFGQLFSTVGLPDEQHASVQIAGEMTIEEMSRRIRDV